MLDFYSDLLVDHYWVMIDDYFAPSGPAFDKLRERRPGRFE